MEHPEHLVKPRLAEAALHLAHIALLAANAACQALLRQPLLYPRLADVLPDPVFHGRLVFGRTPGASAAACEWLNAIYPGLHSPVSVGCTRLFTAACAMRRLFGFSGLGFQALRLYSGFRLRRLQACGFPSGASAVFGSVGSRPLGCQGIQVGSGTWLRRFQASWLFRHPGFRPAAIGLSDDLGARSRLEHLESDKRADGLRA